MNWSKKLGDDDDRWKDYVSTFGQTHNLHGLLSAESISNTTSLSSFDITALPWTFLECTNGMKLVSDKKWKWVKKNELWLFWRIEPVLELFQSLLYINLSPTLNPDPNPKSNPDPYSKPNTDFNAKFDKNQTKDFQFLWVLFSMSTEIIYRRLKGKIDIHIEL